MNDLLLRSIFGKTVYDRRHGVVFWSLGVALLVLVTLSVWPSVRDEYGQLVESYPEALLSFLGVDRAGLGTATGYLQAELFSFMVPLVLIGYGVAGGSGAIAAEEETGTLDLLLSQPVSRSRVVIEKYLGILAAMGSITVALAAVLLVTTRTFGLHVGTLDLLAATLSAYLLGALLGAVALALGAGTGHRALAAGVASALAVASYLLTTLAALVEGLQPLRPLSPFWWYSGHDPLREGLEPLHVALLVGTTVVAVAVAVQLLARRDLH